MEFNTGLNNKTIELKFDTDDRIIMLLGKNGSGKSTILSQMHVYKESFDDRKSLIIEGEEGRKEVDIESDGHLYEIIHIYSKNAQSFIKKDGVELNENGGVRTFEDIVSKELGITKDYFNIGKIGSNARSFVDFTTSERKAYIGKFLNIEDILEKHKIAANKLKILKKDIEKVAGELGRHKDADVIKTEIDLISKSTEEIDAELSLLYKEEGSLTTEIERDAKDIGNISKDDLLLKINEKTLDSETNKKIKTDLEGELEHIDDAEDYKLILNEEIVNLQTEIQLNNSEKNNKNLLLTDFSNRLASTKIQLNSLGNPEDIILLENEIKEITEKISELKNAITKNPFGIIVHKAIVNKKDISKDISKFTEFSNFIEKYFTNLSAKEITAVKSNIEYFFDEDFEESLKRQIQQSKKAIESKQSLLESQQKEKGISESYVCQLKNLEKRPERCNIDDCPFIKDAYAHRNVLSELAEKEKEIIQTKKDIETLTIKAENIQNIDNLYKNFLVSYENVSPRTNEIYIEFLKSKSLIDWLNSPLSDFQRERQNIITSANQAESDIKEFLDLTHKLKNLETSKKLLEDSDSSVKEKYEADINEYEEKIKTLTEELNILIEKGNNITRHLNEKQSLLEKYTKFITASSKFASASTMLSTARTEYARISSLIDNKYKAETKLQEVLNKINSLTTAKNLKYQNLTNLNAELARVEELNERKKKLDSDFYPVSTVEEALSPTKGIPLILMKTYLDETESIANDLLDIAFNGDFQIKFVTTEKEFSIQVESKGNLKPDIKMASQGEMAITTISLSLALIEQSLGGYNILCLDEIDGPLDGSNRNNFINILDNQIKKLGIEQVFIISHNNAFDTAEMGLVLLKDHGIDKDNKVFMENKNIIFEYEGE